MVTKGDVEAEKQRLKILEGQPIKKVAEARARRKKRLQVRAQECDNMIFEASGHS